ncbi:MAG: hypothetical protein ACJA1L_002608 [Paracoccaceae bacterium]|jgi:hypothetical protein
MSEFFAPPYLGVVLAIACKTFATYVSRLDGAPSQDVLAA